MVAPYSAGSKALRQRQRMIAGNGDVKVFSAAEPLCWIVY
jgi:hypothetical protein